MTIIDQPAVRRNQGADYVDPFGAPSPASGSAAKRRRRLLPGERSFSASGTLS